MEVAMGIDPGLDGAAVLIGNGTLLETFPFPTREVQRKTARTPSGKPKRFRVYDHDAIRNWLVGTVFNKWVHGKGAELVVGIERAGPHSHGRPLKAADYNVKAKEILGDLAKTRGFSAEARPTHLVSCMVEKLKAFRGFIAGKEGVISAFRQGAGVEMWESHVSWLCWLVEVYAKRRMGAQYGNVYWIAPENWHSLTGAYPQKDTKARALAAAGDLFPQIDWKKINSRKEKRKGIADATVIAVYTWQQHWPGLPVARETQAVAGAEQGDFF